MALVVAYAHKEREEDGERQPCDVHHQVGSHEHEVVVECEADEHHGEDKDEDACHDAVELVLGLEVGGPIAPRYESENQAAEDGGEDAPSDEDDDDELHNRSAPFAEARGAAVEGAVLAVEFALGHRQQVRQVEEGGEVVVAAVREDALLQVPVAALGVVVELLDVSGNRGVVEVVLVDFLHELCQVFAHSEGNDEAGVAVGLLLWGELVGVGNLHHAVAGGGDGGVVESEVVGYAVHAGHGGHLHRVDGVPLACGVVDFAVFVNLHARRQVLKVLDESVVACHFARDAFLYAGIGYGLFRKLVVEVGSLLAGIGEVERVVVALRIEHQCNLFGTLHVVDQPGVLFLLHGDETLHAAFLLQVRHFEFGTQHTEGTCQVALLEHRPEGEGEEHCQQGQKDFAHMIQMLDRKVCRDRTAVAFLFEKKRRKISVEKYRINSRNILVCGTVRLQWGGWYQRRVICSVSILPSP